MRREAIMNRPSKIRSDAPIVVNPSILLNKPKPIKARLVANITAKYPISIIFCLHLASNSPQINSPLFSRSLRRSPLILLLQLKLALLQAKEPSL